MFRMPDLSHRVTVNGRTGSGKSQFGSWLLSEAPFDQIPYIVIDYKGERNDLLNSIERAHDHDFRKALPKTPGIYRIHPSPYDDDAVERFLFKVYQTGNIGLMFDEAIMIPNQRKNRSAFVAILTQGRALRIPSIVLTQRPSFVSRYAFTEANFYALFELNDMKDVDTVSGFAPVDDPEHPAWNFHKKLAQYSCRWYDLEKHYSCVIKPVPEKQKILARFDERLKPRHSKVRWI